MLDDVGYLKSRTVDVGTSRLLRPKILVLSYTRPQLSEDRNPLTWQVNDGAIHLLLLA